jgi:hypothetical protein
MVKVNLLFVHFLGDLMHDLTNQALHSVLKQLLVVYSNLASTLTTSFLWSLW